MKHATHRQSSFAMLFDPAVARAAVDRAAHWDLPRRVCRPLDRYKGSKVSSDLAAYDAEVERAPVPDEELPEEPQIAKTAGTVDSDPDFDEFED